jgi:osmotically-inducible protein OsmY
MQPATISRPAAGATAGDTLVLQRIRQELARSGYSPLRTVRVDVHEGLVVLRGRVASYHHKQVAQESAKRVDGVDALRNEIVVSR